MAWSELHETVHNEIKIQRLADCLNIEYAHAAGLLTCLWAWATGHQRDGDLSKLTEKEIANTVCRWQQDEKLLVNSLKSCGLLDEDFQIHNWKKRGVKLLEATSKRVSKWRKMKQYRNVTDTLLLPSTRPNQPNPTKPNLKDIKDGGEIPALSVFMAHFTKAIKGKLKADPQASTVKKAYGVAIGYLKTHQDQVEAVCQEVDFLQPGMTEGWYLASLRRIIGDRVHQELKTMTAGIGK